MTPRRNVTSRRKLQGRPAVITGAASGIGRAVAQKLSRTGSQLAIADIDEAGSPDKAAEVICRGVERGKARILVGPDAYVFDALARVAPTRYYDVLAYLEKRMRRN